MIVNMDVAELVQEVMTRRSLPAPPMRSAIRQAAGVSRRRVGQAIGVDTSTVHRWETGETMPRGDHLAAYAELLHQLQGLAS